MAGGGGVDYAFEVVGTQRDEVGVLLAQEVDAGADEGAVVTLVVDEVLQVPPGRGAVLEGEVDVPARRHAQVGDLALHQHLGKAPLQHALDLAAGLDVPGLLQARQLIEQARLQFQSARIAKLGQAGRHGSQ